MGIQDVFERVCTLNNTVSCPKEYLQRKTAVALSSLACLTMGASLTMVMRLDGAVLVKTANLFGVAVAAMLLVWMAFRRMSEACIVAVVYLISAVLIVFDLNARTYGKNSWALLVVVVDALLVMRVDQRFATGLVCLVVLVLVLLFAEGAYRFGILDMPGLVEYPARRKTLLIAVSCERPPCAMGWSEEFGQLLAGLVVFILDFIATRGFANQVLSEQAAMEHTISVVQDVASLLAKYDVEGVARLLAAHEAHLPSRMYVTLQTMEQNLRMYRPYLPAALFEVSEDTTRSSVVVAPPGVASETATLVFTDIRASTSIWEGAPEGMRAGLKIHNTVMRDVMQAFGGYEVKTIGDAFMIAFASTEDGVMFGLRVQEELLAADWPLSLLEDAPICAPQGSLWGGLTVRIGVNTGPVAVELNALTGRTDYFGHTVNVAARLESNCIPGAVAVRSDSWSECNPTTRAATQHTVLDLKGVSGETYVCFLWPETLRQRQHHPLTLKAMPTHDNTSEASGQSSPNRNDVTPSISFSSRHSSLVASGSPAPPFHATLGVVDLSVHEGEVSVLHHMSAGLSSLTVALDQSGGVLVTLLGSCVCVGWNLTRPTPSHMECAVHFAQRLYSLVGFKGASLVSGDVQYGSVGSRTQRFVTAIGSTVQRTWALCEDAVCDRTFLYEPPEATLLPHSLEDLLTPSSRKGIYEVRRLKD